MAEGCSSRCILSPIACVCVVVSERERVKDRVGIGLEQVFKCT